jgi:hypothetical protein
MLQVPRAPALAFVVAVLGSGCGWAAMPAVPADAERIGMVNATTQPVAVLINGVWVGTYPAWSEQRELPIHGHGGPPWKVEFQGRNGLRLAELTVSDEDTRPSVAVGHSSPCGEFRAWWRLAPIDLPTVEGTTPPPADPACR